MKKCNHLVIFTNEIDIDNQIDVSAVTIIFSTLNMSFIMMNKKQIYLRSLIEITIYSEEIMKLDLVLNVIENHLKDRFIVIFSNCQIAIRVIQSLKKQFDQDLLQILTRRMKRCDREIHIHWIFAHVEISDNEAVDIIVKRSLNEDNQIEIICSRHCQFEDTHLSDQKWNSHSRKDWVNWDLKNHFHWKNHLSNHQEAHQECSQKIQKNDTIRKRDHRSDSNK